MRPIGVNVAQEQRQAPPARTTAVEAVGYGVFMMPIPDRDTQRYSKLDLGSSDFEEAVLGQC